MLDRFLARAPTTPSTPMGEDRAWDNSTAREIA
jgi:hypothetical protein